MARSLFQGLLDGLWSGTEFVAALGRSASDGLPRGDRSGVLLVPGLWGGENSLFVLRRDLAHLGYDARTWELGINNRCGDDTVASLIEVARRHRGRHQRPLALIGHSRGGFMAREVARRAPDLTDLVLTLGTPVGSTGLANASMPVQAMLMISRMMFSRRPRCMTDRCECDYVRNVGASLPQTVAAYSLWSRDDGVVVPENCVRSGEPNIEVPGNHFGMVVNRDVFRLIATILARHRAPAAPPP